MFKIILILAIMNNLLFSGNFINEQKRYGRVRDAIKEKYNLIENNLKNNNIKIKELNILIIAFKEEAILELYAKNKSDKIYKKICEYNIAEKSGALGPKRKEGDLQVPEGFYNIEIFNPASSYHLSLGINYPNASDKIKGYKSKLGGDIFIHGSTVTIGCIPIMDDKIKEVYLYSVYATDCGQKKIPVYIFPFKMTNSNFDYYKKYYSEELINFWKDLKTGYDLFQINKEELKIKIDKFGNYIF